MGGPDNVSASSGPATALDLNLMDEDDQAMTVLREHVLTIEGRYDSFAVLLGEHGWTLSKSARLHPNVFRAKDWCVMK